MPALCISEMMAASVTGERANLAEAAAAADTSAGVRTVPAPIRAVGKLVLRVRMMEGAEGVVKAISMQRIPPRIAADAADIAVEGESMRTQSIIGDERRMARVSERGVCSGREFEQFASGEFGPDGILGGLCNTILVGVGRLG